MIDESDAARSAGGGLKNKKISHLSCPYAALLIKPIAKDRVAQEQGLGVDEKK